MPGSTNRILEDPDLKSNINALLSKSGSISHSIYLIIIFLLGLISAGMAIVNVPVYIQARGIIRPSAEVNYILAPVQGIISRIDVSENQFVSKGFQIIHFESEKEILQKNLLNTELSDLRKWLWDLKILTSVRKDSSILLTDKYRIEYHLYKQQIFTIEQKLSLAKTDFQRFVKLFEEKFISEKEYDESALKYKSLLYEKTQFVTEKQRQWINESIDLKIRESELIKQISELFYFIEKSSIQAPVSGIIQGIRTRYPGEFCLAGTLICKLIPDTGLVAELFISPKDIGLISPGQNVRLLIDSYDYKYWGVLHSKCKSISEDVEVIENQPLFRVICELQPQPFLEYHNTRVSPCKGMTLTAQFLIAERNVWQLLRDGAFKIVSKQAILKE